MSETSNQAGVPVRGPACKRCPVLEAQVKRLRAEIERLAREHSFCEPAARLLETELDRAELKLRLRDELATPPSPEDIGMVPVTERRADVHEFNTDLCRFLGLDPGVTLSVTVRASHGEPPTVETEQWAADGEAVTRTYTLALGDMAAARRCAAYHFGDGDWADQIIDAYRSGWTDPDD